MYSSISCDGATHVLSTLLRTVCPTYSIYSSSCCDLTFLRSYAVGHRITVYVFPEFFETNRKDHSWGHLSRFCGTRVPTHTHPSTFSHHHPPPAATIDGPPEGFPGQEYQVDRDRRYDVSSCRRAYERKECGDYGSRGLRLIEKVTYRTWSRFVF